MKLLKTDARGQAIVEYLIVFGFLAIITINMVRALNGYISQSMGGLAYALTQQLSVGVCPENCFDDSYLNRVD